MGTTTFPVRNAGQTVVGPLNIYVAPGGTAEPIIDVPVINAGTQTLVYGAAANAAGVDGAIASAVGETGFGRGASLELSIPQQGSAAWVAWVAVSQDLASVPTSDLTASFTKRGTTVDKDGETLTVYTANGIASETSATVTVTFAGDQLWHALGYQEACDIDEAGITVSHNQTYTEIRCVGSPGPTKITRDTDDFMVAFDLKDLTAETYARVMDRAELTYSPASAKVRTVGFNMHRDTEMEEYALCARGVGLSSYVKGGNIQYWAPFVVQTGNLEPVFSKTGAAALSTEWRAVEDRRSATAARYGRFVQQGALRA